MAPRLSRLFRPGSRDQQPKPSAYIDSLGFIEIRLILLFLLSLVMVVAIAAQLVAGIAQAALQSSAGTSPGATRTGAGGVRQNQTQLPRKLVQRKAAAAALPLKASPAAPAPAKPAASSQVAPSAVDWRWKVSTTRRSNPQDSKPLPWRALHHLNYAANNSNNMDDIATVHAAKDPQHEALSAARAPAYLISAFLDTRPTVQQQRPRLAVMLAVNKHINTQGWRCLLSYYAPNPGRPNSNASVPAGTAAGPSYVFSDLAVRHIHPNSEAFFKYEAATGFCDLPAALDAALSTTPSSAKEDQLQQQRLTLTVVASAAAGNNQSAVSTARQTQETTWVEVEINPNLILSEAKVANHASGSGSLGVCTPPVHTDAYASTLVEWAEFQRLLGVSKVFMYSFNPGPLLKPLVDFYEAEGFFEVHEWIIPSSILSNKQQQCKLPFFHASNNRAKHGSPNCTYHQDNYQIAWWGQTLAVQDCVYRAMARYRWVAVIDLDEYILPRLSSTPTLPALIQYLTANNNGKLAAQYSFAGTRLCAGCTAGTDNMLTSINSSRSDEQQQPSAAAAQYTVRQQAAPGAPEACLFPAVGFHHSLWSTVTTGEGQDHMKSVVDPLAVEQAGVHTTRAFSPYALVPGVVNVPSNVAVKLHDRVHDIHRAETFALKMLPLLKQHIGQVINAGLGAAAELPVYPADSTCGTCGSVSRRTGSPLLVDYTLCNLYGRNLSQRISTVLRGMWQAGTFGVWESMNQSVANVYGGHVFDKWAPPG